MLCEYAIMNMNNQVDNGSVGPISVEILHDIRVYGP